MRTGSVLGLALVIAAPSVVLAGSPATPPTSPKNPVVDTYHGVQVTDQYRWLENWEDPVVKAWSEAQNAYARSYLDGIASAPALRERVTQLENAVGPRYLAVHPAHGRFFATKSVPGLQQPVIVVLDSLASTANERTIFDPNTFDPTGGTSFDWFVPSPDGTMIAVSVSSGGSESGDARIFDVATGTERSGDMVPGVNGGTAGGSLAWNADSKGFFYTRYPREGERPAEDLHFFTQVYHHVLGTPESTDTFQTGRDYPKIAEIAIEVSPDGAWALTNVQNGDGGEFLQDIRTPSGEWVRISAWDDRIVEAKFGHDNAAYLVSRKDALMGKVLRLPLDPSHTPALSSATPVVPEQKDASIETDFTARSGVYLTDSRLFVLYQVGGPNELRAFAIERGSAAPLGAVPSLPISSVDAIEHTEGNGIVFRNDSFITPPAWFVLDPGSGKGIGTVEPTALKQQAPPNMPELAVRREFATSKDGTKVPINIVALKGFFTAFDAHKDSFSQAIGGTTVPRPIPAPAVVWGYGGYGNSETPAFSRRIVLFCEQGGVYALTNIRGGSEYGEKWHTDGNLTRKQNVFDDFQAAARYMIDKGYTTSDRLAIFGGSNGGLLMGATFTQQPTLAKAVVSYVGIYDMLRVELSPNGAFNITEFGTVKDKPQFDALYAYSPYHHVATGTRYPAILFLTGANDPRVDPMQSRKMTALLQSAQTGLDAHVPVYLRTSGNTGHGMGTPLNERIEQTVDSFAFLFDQLGVKFVAPTGH